MRDIVLATLSLLIGVFLAYFLPAWKPGEVGRFVLVTLIVNCILITGFLGLRGAGQLRGELTPKSNKPVNLKDWGFADANPPSDSLKVLFGSNLFVLTQENQTLLRVRGKKMVRTEREKRFFPFDDRLRVLARFTSADGKLIGQIRGAQWEINSQNFFTKEIGPYYVRAQSMDGVVFSFEYLNPDFVKINGTFKWKKLIVRADDEGITTIPGNNVISHNYVQGFSTGIAFD